MIAQTAAVIRQLGKALLQPFAGEVERVRHLVDRMPALALMVLALLLLAVFNALLGSRWAAVAVIPLALGWLVVNSPFEGPTLLVLSSSHGVTVSDLISVVAVLVALWRLTPVLLGR